MDYSSLFCVTEIALLKWFPCCACLQHGLADSYIPLTLTLSARTSVNHVQDRVDSSLEKRQRGMYGPSAGSTFVLFVDDMNLPEREQFGAQPPLELLRQVSDCVLFVDTLPRIRSAFERLIFNECASLRTLLLCAAVV